MLLMQPAGIWGPHVRRGCHSGCWHVRGVALARLRSEQDDSTRGFSFGLGRLGGCCRKVLSCGRAGAHVG